MASAAHIERGKATRAEKYAAVFAEQEVTALALIEKAARLKQPCPSNLRLAHAMGLKSSGSPSAILKRLEQRGLIAIGRDGNDRVVRILASGLQTAGAMAAPPRPGSTGPRRRMTRKDRFAEALAECGQIEAAAQRIGVAHDTARRLFAEICQDLGEQAR